MSPEHDLRPGDVVVAQTPGVVNAKRRPALVIAREGSYVHIMAISSTHKPIPARANDIPIPDWRAASLHRQSYLRPDDVQTLPATACRWIGVLPESLVAQALEAHGRALNLVPTSLVTSLSHAVDKLQQELGRWRSVAARLPGQPRTPEELSRALDNLSLHIRRLEQAAGPRRPAGRGRVR